MSLEVVTSSEPVLAALKKPGQSVVIGFFSEKSEVCRRALPAFEEYCAAQREQPAYLVDVTVVRDVHPRFDVTAMPTVLLVRDGKVLQQVVGPQSAAFYARALKPRQAAAPVVVAGPEPKAKSRPAHSVVVYTTDVCPWCTRVKSYLRQNDVQFREINVQHDASAARRMVERSGQQGVPQVDIDGRVVVGFDKGKIDALLGLSARSA
jgi:glutaredoxin-like YruB-family protein